MFLGADSSEGLPLDLFVTGAARWLGSDAVTILAILLRLQTGTSLPVES